MLAWPGLAVLVAALLLAWLALRAAVTASGRLRWDGQQWWLLASSEMQAAEQPVTVDLHLDLGAWVLLSARVVDKTGSRGRRAWLALQQSATDGHWPSLRRALMAPSRGRQAAVNP